MRSDEEVTQEELATVLQERGAGTLKRFERIIFSGINNPKILSILTDVKDYWKDTYRPALVSLSCEAVGGQPEDSTTASLMVTLAGAGIGIHDDIIDKTTNKHFRRTILGLHNHDDALLVGDLLIVKALTAVQEIVKKAYRPKQVADIIEAYQHFLFEVCEGVFMEKTCRNTIETNLGFYHKVLWKLGSDVEACTRLGAIVGGGTRREVEALSEYGRRMGYVFRLAEDTKDTLNLEGNLAHRLGNESVPLPLLYAAKASKDMFFQIESILKRPITLVDVKTLLECCFDTKAFEYVRDIACKNVIEGTRVLTTLPPSDAIDVLTLMIQKTFPRFF